MGHCFVLYGRLDLLARFLEGPRISIRVGYGTKGLISP